MDPALLDSIAANYKVFLLLLVRIGGMLFMMPAFSAKTIPVQVKAAASLILALMFTPMAPFGPEAIPTEPIEYAILAVTETFIGMTLALIIKLMFTGLQMAGQLIGFQMGFAVANVVDPQTGAQSVIVSQFAYLIALMLFLAADGHHVVLKALYDSFFILSPGTLYFPDSLGDIILTASREMFVLAVKLMAPVMAILLFSQVALGILAKTVPQINLLIVSFGLNIGLGLFFMGLTLQAFWPVLAQSINKAVEMIPAAMLIMAGA